MKDIERYEVYVCPDCGEQITETAYDPAKGAVQGHYHDPPEGWYDEEGGPGPANPQGIEGDPWLDAKRIEVTPAHLYEQEHQLRIEAEAREKQLREALAHLLSRFKLVLRGKPAPEVDHAIVAAESLLSTRQSVGPSGEGEERSAS